MDVLHYNNHSVHTGITYAGTTLMVQYYDVIIIYYRPEYFNIKNQHHLGKRKAKSLILRVLIILCAFNVVL